LPSELKKYLSPSLLILDELGYLPIRSRMFRSRSLALAKLLSHPVDNSKMDDPSCLTDHQERFSLVSFHTNELYPKLQKELDISNGNN
jgi:hypothetical protein